MGHDLEMQKSREALEDGFETHESKDDQNYDFETEEDLSHALRQVQVRSFFTLLGQMLGLGVFNTCTMIVHLGILWGSLWVILFGYFSAFCQHRLLDIAFQYEIFDYKTLGQASFGFPGFVLITLSTAVPTYFANAAHVRAAMGCLQRALTQAIVDIDIAQHNPPIASMPREKFLLMTLLFLAAVIPFCFKKTVTSLRYASVFNIMTVLTLSVVILIVSCVKLAHSGVATIPLVHFEVLNLEHIGSLAFGYPAIMYLSPVMLGVFEDFSLLRSEQAKTKNCIHQAITWSTIVATIIYLSVGLMGSLAYGEDIKAYVYDNAASTSSPAFAILIFLLACGLLLLYPVMAFVPILTLESFVPSSQFTRPSLVMLIYLSTAICVTYLTAPVAIALCCSLGLSIGAYGMPALMYLNARRECRSHKFYVSVVVLALAVLLFFSTGVTVWDIVHPQDAANQHTITLIEALRQQTESS